MKSNKPKRNNAPPERNLLNDKGNKAASVKKAPRNDNRRLAVQHASFRVQDPETNRIYTVFMALCAKGQKPWKNRNFGTRIDKYSFRNQMLDMDVLS